MSANNPHDARENGLEEDLDPLGEPENLDSADLDRRIREEGEEITRHANEPWAARDENPDPLGSSHL